MCMFKCLTTAFIVIFNTYLDVSYQSCSKYTFGVKMTCYKGNKFSLNLLGLYIDTLIIGHIFCSQCYIANEMPNVMTNNVFWTN